MIKRCGNCGREISEAYIRQYWKRIAADRYDVASWNGECECGSGDLAFEIRGKILDETATSAAAAGLILRLAKLAILIAASAIPFG